MPAEFKFCLTDHLCPANLLGWQGLFSVPLLLHQMPGPTADFAPMVCKASTNLKVDWTEPHRDDVRAAVRAAVKRVLRKRDEKEEDFEPSIRRFMAQAEALYAEWPLAA